MGTPDTAEELWAQQGHLEHILGSNLLWRTLAFTKRGTHVFIVRSSHILFHFIFEMAFQELFLSFYL